MRIHSIEAIPIDIPLSRNFGGSTYAVVKRSTVITRMRTEDSLVSEVYNGDNREHGPAIVRLIHEELAPLVKGQSLFEGERLWEAMFALSHRAVTARPCWRRSPAWTARGWDLVGKALGRSVNELLGGYRAALQSSRSAGTPGGQDAGRHRPRDGDLSAGGDGGLQVQGWRTGPRAGRRAGDGGAPGGRAGLRAGRGREPGLVGGGRRPLRAARRAARHPMVRGALRLV